MDGTSHDDAIMELRKDMREIARKAEDALSRISSHEAVCSVRYEQIVDSQHAMRSTLTKGVLMLMGGMASIIFILMYDIVKQAAT